MTFEEVNEILGDMTQGVDGYGCKLERNHNTDKIYLISISSDDGGVNIREVPDSEENWMHIAHTFKESEGDKYFDEKSRMEEAVDAHSIHVISSSFWG